MKVKVESFTIDLLAEREKERVVELEAGEEYVTVGFGMKIDGPMRKEKERALY